ncbi:MAG: ATP-binding protein, partial [Candidatus Brockarchaeota archaeon]|nr:ATP-binding protein [Candidatus Brockarchaeota archaeon]
GVRLREEQLFDDIDGRFQARVRTHGTSFLKTSIRGTEVTLRSSTATLETRFNMLVLDKLHSPSFVGIERPTASNPKTFLIYEVIGVRATHLQELGVRVSMPGVLREEFLQTIEKDWETARENWIDVVAAPTGYLARVVNGIVEFEKTTISPLTGKQAHLLSKEAVEAFVCVENGAEVGRLMGLNVPVTAKIDAMIRYHTGVFGFTGTGKSNLTSTLVRKAVETVEGLRVVVFDVAGEYVVNLLDLLEDGLVYTTERGAVENVEEFVRSQTIPESLEEELGAERIEKALRTLHENGRVRRLVLTEPSRMKVLVEDVLNFLGSIVSSERPGAIAAKIALERLVSFIEENGIRETDRLLDVAADPRRAEAFRSILKEFGGELHGMSSEAKTVNTILRVLENPREITSVRREAAVNPERLAELTLGEEAPCLTIVYAPDLVEARKAVSRYVDRLLELKKKGFSRVNVLTVLDEAQEFVPDKARKEDATEQSNTAVETLLRQGRKYRAGCWLSTQRVAHLNVNALQQLHTYFTSTLPRSYDRMVIADAYSLDYEVVNRVAELDTGEWMFVSYKATKRRNVPVFISTPNNEQKIVEHVKKLTP